MYLSSGMHRGGEPSTDDLQWSTRRWQGAQAYSDSKLWDTVLAFAVARRHPELRSNAVDPGWVATKMGGAGAPDDLDQGAETQVWLAVSDDPGAEATGRLFYHLRPDRRESGRVRHRRPGPAPGCLPDADRRDHLARSSPI